MSQALYRKYRSKSFKEIVGQKNTVKALQTAIKTGAISHAYLFSGPRGVGKTSIARILAYEIIKTPYQDDNLPIDIIEIDAASNRGIDEIRDLREKVHIAPVSAPYKVYIIDEVHMLTTHAFNALLKTLEEPPKHVVFILATTESYKLPETILSRTQRYSFKLASMPEIVEHLEYISKQENVTIDSASLNIIAKHSGGSMRDALSALDHIRHVASEITEDNVRSALGVPPNELVESIYIALQQNNPSKVLKSLEQAEQSNASAVVIAKELQNYVTDLIKLNNFNLTLEQITTLLKGLIQVDTAQDPNNQLFLALLAAIDTSSVALPNKVHTSTNNPPKKEEKIVKEPAQKTTIKDKKIVKDTKINNLDTEPDNNQNNQQINSEVWQNTLNALRETHNTLYSVLRMAKFSAPIDGEIVLTFTFDFHQKRVDDSKNKRLIQDTLANIGYADIEIITQIDKKKSTNLKIPSRVDTDIEPKEFDKEVTSVQNIFGSVQVLE
ncbi:MAG: polymerase subunit gamma/tau [Patescibacteria group bacterium]|nr:polymerase subunit gamma/tau [Patescibacteria group bacterium]